MKGDISRHIASAEPRVLVIDGSKVVRRLIQQVLEQQLPEATVVSCGSGEEARAALEQGVVDFVTLSLRLPDIDGLELARYIRKHSTQAYVPIVVISGDVDERLRERSMGDEVTDYFDKSLGFQALADFIRGYVRPEDPGEGEVLYIEDSRVVALATRRMMEKHGLKVLHDISVEDALARLETARVQGRIGADVVLTDVTLKGQLTGGDLLRAIRTEYGYNKGQLPVLVMTGDDNPDNQAELIRAGANDLVVKPVEERLLITKLLFQLRVAWQLRARGGA